MECHFGSDVSVTCISGNTLSELFENALDTSVINSQRTELKNIHFYHDQELK